MRDLFMAAALACTAVTLGVSPIETTAEAKRGQCSDSVRRCREVRAAKHKDYRRRGTQAEYGVAMLFALVIVALLVRPRRRDLGGAVSDPD